MEYSFLRCFSFPFWQKKAKWRGLVPSSAYFESLQVTLIKEYAQGLHDMVYGLPTGGYDPDKHSSRLDCAIQELSEEVVSKKDSAMKRSIRRILKEAWYIH